MFILGLLIAAVPLGFGALRAVTTGSDWRYLWVAVSACTIALGVLWFRRQVSGPSLGRIATAFVAAGVAAAALAFAQGATSVAAVLTVAGGFGLCEAIGLGLAFRARAG
ncbi:MAG: hypothetical protein IPP90_23225 [Gemmatimonadaceae bacterium]|nr:hypothetical protein [Gemmatimonadaceae bacterium]